MADSRSPRFKKVYIEITNVCNLSCAFCPGTVREPAFMSALDFERIIGDLAGYTRYIYLHVMGEPLLNPELAKILEISRAYGLRTNITTNGTLIAQKAQELLDASSLRQVNFSLHSQEGIDDTSLIDKYSDDIFAFTLRALNNSGIYVSYRLWNIGSPSSERFNKYILSRIEKRFGLDYPLWDAFIDKARLTIRDRLFLNRAEVFEWPDAIHTENHMKIVNTANCGADRKTAENAFCLGLRDQLAILADGTVVPCCLDSNGTISLGNILKQDIGHILNSERAQAFYRGFSERRAVEPLCMNCGFRKRFS